MTFNCYGVLEEESPKPGMGNFRKMLRNLASMRLVGSLQTQPLQDPLNLLQIIVPDHVYMI